MMIEARKIYRLLVIAGLLFIYGCEGNKCPDCSTGPSREALEMMVVDNCLVLQAAVEEYAAQNYRRFPVRVMEDSTDTGLMVIDLLPGGERLVNPFTGQRSEPVDRRAAYPGEVGYEEFGCSSYCAGYTITGCGWDSIIVVLTNLDALDDTVRANCLLVQQAAEKFASLSCGIYPGSLGDCTPCGNTLIDLLPGGTLLMNPFSGCRCEPIDGWAAIIGETGYEVVAPLGVNVGYRITGRGHDPDFLVAELTNIGSIEEASLRFNCLFVLYMANRFAGRNNGEFPRDIDTDMDPEGNTLLDLLMERNHGEFLRNPYTGEYDQPVDRRASNPGETGYEAVSYGGSVVACIVTGVGEVADSLIVEFDSREVGCQGSAW